MKQTHDPGQAAREAKTNGDEHFLRALARAAGGALIFSIPMLMTMEMWWLGFYMDGWRAALLFVLNIPLLVGLSHYIGFEETFEWKDDLLDAFVAYAVGFIVATTVLFLFAVLGPGMSADEIIGKISLQAIPGSIGAMLAQSQLGGDQGNKEKEKKKQRAGYFGEIFIMAVGALFLAFNLAPTEEMVLIAHKMTSWHTIGLALLSILIVHSFVYVLSFKGQASVPEGVSRRSIFLRFTIVGYAVALLISLYILWTFGRLDGVDLYQVVNSTIVLSFPASMGAAAARLIL